MVSLLKRIYRKLNYIKTRLQQITSDDISRFVGDFFVLKPKSIKLKAVQELGRKKRVLVIGVVLQDRENHYKHISAELNKSKHHEVKQVWTILKSNKKLDPIQNIEHIYFDDYVPRSKLLNLMIQKYSSDSYDFIIVLDDDIRLPANFVDQFLLMQESLGFALAQPARTTNSIISHDITRQRSTLVARETMFVEIGPLISIRRDIHNLVLPMEEISPMGWGLEYVWSRLLLDEGKKMGIIDGIPVAHTLRETSKTYDMKKAEDDMNSYLAMRPHVEIEEAHKAILHEYTDIPSHI